MSFISVFDVLGPNMIGPSSSHTAGAAAIALLAGKMPNAAIKKADFILYGSFARTYKGHGTDRALLGGIMGFSTDDRRIPDSFSIADERGLQYSFTANTTETEIHPNTVDIHMTDENGQKLIVRGESVGEEEKSESQESTKWKLILPENTALLSSFNRTNPE